MAISEPWARSTALGMIQRDILKTFRSTYPDGEFGEGVRQLALALGLITDQEEREYSSSAKEAVDFRRAELRGQKHDRIVGRAAP
ncbi:hypothetical protein M2D07_006500 [Pseudomonas sp. BGr12]|uniref:hypothetical protein n=1 Tax=Pseudomonas sp. BGr12 TaxID=2936269 RepID=UPI002559E147|nr:hypothetical protein [Pseudomonas sp. BJa5]MDL2426665.1 hypothetical protein [Pseudomonas sp. BJa5]